MVLICVAKLFCGLEKIKRLLHDLRKAGSELNCYQAIIITEMPSYASLRITGIIIMEGQGNTDDTDRTDF